MDYSHGHTCMQHMHIYLVSKISYNQSLQPSTVWRPGAPTTGPPGKPRINRTVTEEGAAGRVLIDQQSTSGHYYLDTWHHLALRISRLILSNIE